jgi:hypothetical protein
VLANPGEARARAFVSNMRRSQLGAVNVDAAPHAVRAAGAAHPLAPALELARAVAQGHARTIAVGTPLADEPPLCIDVRPEAAP